MWRCEVALATQRAGQLANIQLQTPDVLTTEQYKHDAEIGAYDLDHLRSVCAGGDAAGEHAVHRTAAAGSGLARRKTKTQR